MSIQHLLKVLNDLFPISIGFRNDLTDFLSEEVCLAKLKKLLEIGSHVNSACFLAMGFIVGKDKNGKVIRLFGPGSIITDLASFFDGVVASIELFAAALS